MQFLQRGSPPFPEEPVYTCLHLLNQHTGVLRSGHTETRFETVTLNHSAPVVCSVKQNNGKSYLQNGPQV